MYVFYTQLTDIITIPRISLHPIIINSKTPVFNMLLRNNTFPSQEDWGLNKFPVDMIVKSKFYKP